MNVPLLPCPFCGSVPHIIERGTFRSFACDKESSCYGTGIVTVWPKEDGDERAVEWWNKRAAAPAQPEQAVCDKCKGSGEIEGNVPHPFSGDPQDDEWGAVPCPKCNGTGGQTARPALTAEQPEQAVAWTYRINGIQTHFCQVKPPDDAYDEGTLVALYARPALTDEQIREIAERPSKILNIVTREDVIATRMEAIHEALRGRG